jgi:hypothetical protein
MRKIMDNRIEKFIEGMLEMDNPNYSFKRKMRDILEKKNPTDQEVEEVVTEVKEWSQDIFKKGFIDPELNAFCEKSVDIVHTFADFVQKRRKAHNG